MGSDGIEITQDGSVQTFIGVCFVADNLFVDLLSIAVRRERLLNRCGLIDGQMCGVGLTINGAGGREDDIGYLVLFH